jgi:hypothetical protein
MFRVGDKVKITGEVTLTETEATILRVPDFLKPGREPGETFPYKVAVQIWLTSDDIDLLESKVSP